MDLKFQKRISLFLGYLALVLSLEAILPSVGVAQTTHKVDTKQLAELVLSAQIMIDEYKGQGDYLKRAGELLNKAVRLDPNYAPIYAQAARLAIAGGHIVSYEFVGGTLETAESLLRKAISLNPSESDAFLLLGHVTRLMGRYDEALLNLNKASELKSQSPWLFNNYGAYYEGINQIEKASEYYIKAVENGAGSSAHQRNSYIDALLKLQWFAALKDDDKNVLKYGEMATTVAAPNDAWTWGNVGNVLFVQGYFDEAENHARKALSIMNYGVGRNVLALTLYGKWAKAVFEGRPEQGEAFFIEAYRLKPDLNDVVSRFNTSAESVKSLVPIVSSRQIKLLAQQQISLAASTEQGVTFTGPQDFAVVSTATGKVSRSGPLLSVVLDRYTMKANAKSKTPQKIVRYKVGLAFATANGAWDISRWSEPIAQDIVLAPGDVQQIEGVKAVIPVDGLLSLKDYWLVLAVEIDNDGKGSYTYAHSSKGLFK